MAVSPGLLLAGLIVKTIFGAVVVATFAVFLWKAGRLADAYAEKLKSK